MFTRMHPHLHSLSLAAMGAAALAAAPMIARASSASFTSAAVDRDLYREGEVRRVTGAYADWTLVCDEIQRIRRRFCSLESAALGAAGNAVARIIVSTGDDGRPAALMHLPLGISLRHGVELAIESSTSPRRAGHAATSAPPRQVPIATCDTKACTALWTLTQSELDALAHGLSLHLHYRFVASVPALAADIIAPARTTMIDGTVAAQGFAEAVAASLQ
jgi:invasion protein IalB